MAIYLRCPNCSSDMSTTLKKCNKCGEPIPNRNKKYKIKVYIKETGKCIVKMANNLQLAKEIESAIKTDVTRNEFNIQKKEALTLDDVWEKFLPWAKENKKTWKTDMYYYQKHLQPVFGEKRLNEITPFHIESFVIKIKKNKSQRDKPYSAATIKHQLVLLTRLYSIAEQWELYSGDNPCKKIKKPKLNNQVTEYLSNDELKRLLDVLKTWPDKMSSSFILFCLHTGIRRGELFKLQWRDIDAERQTMTLKDPKGKIDQTLPLSDMAVGILQSVPREYKTPWIFYGANGGKRVDFKGPWLRIKKAAGLPESFRLHGLRHHFASSLVSNGVDLFTVQKLLCHKDASTTQRYAHLADRTLRDAVKISDDLLTPKESNIIDINEVKNGK